LATRVAEVERVEAELQRAMNNERRSIALRAESKDYISEAEIDQFHFARTSLEAQLKVAKAAIDQAKANLSNSEANLAYTEIRSPVEGIVIDKKIDPGQTLAAQFQTPELFIVAPEMEEKMHVFASVDEADIGFIRAAQEAGHKVEFTVDAYPDDLFEGQIEQIRFSSTVTQNVVMYPVVVSAPNPDLKLLPGMTADLSFQVEAKKDVICIPNAALRFFPNAQQVREADRKLLDGAAREEAEQTDSESSEQENSSAKERIEAGIERNQRHVWVQEGKFLKAILVTTGISDFQYTEVLSGDLEVEQELVVGIKPKP
jgi:HlyD family secretion protein